MLRSEIRTRVRYFLRETTASVWTDTEINDQIDLAQRYVAYLLDTRHLPQLVQSDSKTSTGAAYEDLNAAFMKMASDPSVAGAIHPLVSISDAMVIKNYDAYQPNYQQKISWIQNNDIYFSPTPTSGNAIVWYYAKYPVNLSGDSTASEIQEPFIELVISRAAGICLMKTDPERAVIIIREVDKQIQELNK